ncbi:MAG: O-antigen ligase family protein [Anaerolineae bacterium]|nr:O-antigen ligase family protein [Anaerolineae bacterium]
MNPRFTALTNRAAAGPRTSAVAVGVACGLAAGLVGFGLATLGPIYTFAFAAGAAAALWMLTDLNVALYAVVAVICLLPFGTLPFKIAITPSFLELAMGAVLVVYFFQWMTGRRWGFVKTPLHPLILAFIVILIFSFVAGLGHAGINAALVRKFADLVLSVGFTFVVVDIVRTLPDLRNLARIVVVAGTLAALAGIVLYVMPDDLAERTLIRLASVGYPSGGVVRYVEDNPALNERAISTSVDPNVLGGMLVMVAGLAAPQVFAHAPLFGRRWAGLAMLGALAACLVLTFSRGSMVAFVCALGFIGLLRYRKLLILLALGAVIFLLLPPTQDYITHFVEGLQVADLATQMRIGEYQDAFTAIGRHPLIGVGFAGAPEIDIYLGVANVYLTMLINMGILGTGIFLLLIGGVFVYAAQYARRIRDISELDTIWLGIHAGLVGALANGMLDHYFFKLDFHHASTLFWLYVALALAATRLGDINPAEL